MIDANNESCQHGFTSFVLLLVGAHSRLISASKILASVAAQQRQFVVDAGFCQ